MKVKVISRDSAEFSRERSSDIQKSFRNYDPSIHPFERAIEYTRALNAVKLERLFAKPFIGALSGHLDAVYCVTKHSRLLNVAISGSCDGEIRVWDLSSRSLLWAIPSAHERFIRGVVVSPEGESLLSCSDDQTVKCWRLNINRRGGGSNATEPTAIIRGKSPMMTIDHHYSDDKFATGGTGVDIWNLERSDPVESFKVGNETVLSVKFNPVENSILASSSTDRSIVLYDLRSSSPLQRIVMEMKTNSLCWNPQETINFTAANEDHNLYTFDMRKMDTSLCIHEGHVGPVMNVDYSPTGREFVSGSYDRTVRIYGHNSGQSRDVYHTKRMQRVFCVEFSSDGRYVLSGGDDTNLRIWKSEASRPLRKVLPREEQALRYNKKLIRRHIHLPEVRRIAMHRHVPKAIINATKLKETMKSSKKRKDQNRRLHEKEPEEVIPARKRRIISTE